MSPDEQTIRAFVRRVFLCHHCGADGPEQRDTDDDTQSVRFRLGSDQLLLPHCPACRAHLDGSGRWQSAARLIRAVVSDTLAWIDLTPLSSYRCSVPACGTGWHHLGGPTPYEPVADPGPTTPDRAWHPCPWCVRDDARNATAAHHDRAVSRGHVERWERELREPAG